MTELTQVTEMSFTDPTVVRAIQLVWREAALLDDKAYEVWQDLYTDDGVYVVPIDPDTEDFASSLNMVYDDKRLRGMRVERMVQGYSPSAVAAARTVRTVSRFQVRAASDTEVTLTSAQVLVAYKRGRTDVLPTAPSDAGVGNVVGTEARGRGVVWSIGV